MARDYRTDIDNLRRTFTQIASVKNPEELKNILMDKYREIFKLANSTWRDVKKGNDEYKER